MAAQFHWNLKIYLHLNCFFFKWQSKIFYLVRNFNRWIGQKHLKNKIVYVRHNHFDFYHLVILLTAVQPNRFHRLNIFVSKVIWALAIKDVITNSDRILFNIINIHLMAALYCVSFLIQSFCVCVCSSEKNPVTVITMNFNQDSWQCYLNMIHNLLIMTLNWWIYVFLSVSVLCCLAMRFIKITVTSDW